MAVKPYTPNTGIGEVEYDKPIRACCVCGGSWDIPVPVPAPMPGRPTRSQPNPNGNGLCWTCHDKRKPGYGDNGER